MAGVYPRKRTTCLRFDPNMRDDRLNQGFVSSRRVHKEPKKEEPKEELIATDPEHVLPMDPSTRLDWFQMALLQVATGKLKATALYDTVLNARFATTKKLRQTVLANLHLFSAKQQKALKEAISKLEGVEEQVAEDAPKEKVSEKGKEKKEKVSNKGKAKKEKVSEKGKSKANKASRKADSSDRSASSGHSRSRSRKNSKKRRRSPDSEDSSREESKREAEKKRRKDKKDRGADSSRDSKKEDEKKRRKDKKDKSDSSREDSKRVDEKKKKKDRKEREDSSREDSKREDDKKRKKDKEKSHRKKQERRSSSPDRRSMLNQAFSADSPTRK